MWDMDAKIEAAVLTVSDGVSAGTRADESGELATSILTEQGFDVPTRRVVPDDRSEIEGALRDLAVDHPLVVTTGGTGFGPRDVTPEATRAVIDREAPGLTELMRAEGLTHTPMAALSRAVAGSVGSTLIVNLPGSPSGVREGLAAVGAVMQHAVELLGGATGAHPTGHRAMASAQRGIPAPRSGTLPVVDAKAVRVHGSPPCSVGATMSVEVGGQVRGTLGCSEFDAAAIEAAAEIAASGGAEIRTFTHDLGEVEVYLEPRPVAAMAYIVSATDVARALRAHLTQLGYGVVLVEPRGERTHADDGPVRPTIDAASIGERDVVVVTDHDAPGVVEVLAEALRSPARFIGIMGSRRHVGGHVGALRTLGFADADIARVRSPLGLDLGGRDPASVALSIAAGVVADAHGRDGGWLDR
jgi:molybdenum cofactor biosynthesis protein B